MRAALATRASAPSGIPFSPAAVTTTRQSWARARASASRRSSEAELSIARAPPGASASSPARITSMREESIESGRSVMPWTVRASQAMAAVCTSSFGDISSTLRSTKAAPARS